MKYIDADKLIERLEDMKQAEYENCGGVNSKTGALQEVQELIASLQQEQPDFDDVDPKHLVHSHYIKVREIKTGRVFWAEYSSDAAEWYKEKSRMVRRKSS